MAAVVSATVVSGAVSEKLSVTSGVVEASVVVEASDEAEAVVVTAVVSAVVSSVAAEEASVTVVTIISAVVSALAADVSGGLLSQAESIKRQKESIIHNRLLRIVSLLSFGFSDFVS